MLPEEVAYVTRALRTRWEGAESVGGRAARLLQRLAGELADVREANAALSRLADDAASVIAARDAELETAKAALREVRDRRGVLCADDCTTSSAMVEIASMALAKLDAKEG